MVNRRKSFLTYFALCAAPLLLLAGLNWWNGYRSVDSTIRSIVQEDLNSLNAGVDQVLQDQGSAMLRLAMMRNIQEAVSHPENPQRQTASSSLKSVLDLRRHFQSLALFDRNRNALWYGTQSTQWENWDKSNTVSGNISQPDDRIWTAKGNVLLDRPGTLPSNAKSLEYTVPVHSESGSGNDGALVGVLDLESIFSTASRGLEARASSGSTKNSMVMVVDRSGNVVYHSDRWLKLRPANEAVPGFDSITAAMNANENGLREFQSSGTSYVAAYAPIPRLDVSVAVARNRSVLLSGTRLWGGVGVAIASLTALLAAFVLNRHVKHRSQGIERVAEDVSAIAKGELDRRILLKSSDDARGLADNINVVTERLRAQVAREAESRQFESFVRLSAMLTHDLKNAIEGLSLTVGNMERHFDNPQFRTDALKGLTNATDG